MLSRLIGGVRYLLLASSLVSLLVLTQAGATYKSFGSIAWFLLILVMWIRPFADLFPRCRVFRFVLRLRRELGILVGVFGLAHVFGYILMKLSYSEYSGYFDIFSDPEVWRLDGFLFWGMIGALVSIPLLVTSNTFSARLLGRRWKLLQRLSYVMFITVALHISLIDHEAGPAVPVVLWGVFFALASWRNKKKISTQVSCGDRWLCVPCGYIYDPSVGDPDSGISAGTPFDDIPSDWRCPVCGVTKSDFIRIEEGRGVEEIVTSQAEILSLVSLTPDTIELVIDTQRELDFRAGQFLGLQFCDQDGAFIRSYSIARREGSRLTFLIRVKSSGRAGQILPTLRVGDHIRYTRIAGTFSLSETDHPKVFIATGTGLAPIYAMLLACPTTVSRRLYFGVSRLADLFYLDQLRAIPGLEIEIFLSREPIEGYHFGRIDCQTIEATPETEWYICGNPALMEEATRVLQGRGYTSVFTETF